MREDEEDDAGAGQAATERMADRAKEDASGVRPSTEDEDTPAEGDE